MDHYVKFFCKVIVCNIRELTNKNILDNESVLGPKTVNDLIEKMNHEDCRVRKISCRILCYIGRRSRKFLSYLIKKIGYILFKSEI